MNQQQAFQAYSKARVQTANPEKLILLLYQGGIKHLTLAEQSLERGEVRDAHDHLVRAQDIVAELAMALDVNRGGEVARGLQQLYEYMVYRLVRANVDKDVTSVVDVRGMLEDLLAAWHRAIEGSSPQQRSEPTPVNVQA